jgi:hypothetical protein
MPFGKIFTLSNLVLVTALTLSGIAAWYSILGLVAIFAAAVIPIIIMGGALEFAKVVTTVWLHRYWDRISWQLRLYLVPAVISLALLTSMGIFGFLSKAHMDQGIVSGDSQAKLSLYDEKIKTQRDNIEIARKALTQMDAQVDARLSRGDSESGAERAVQIRRQQAKERQQLQKEIGDAQKEIARLNEERAPIAAENRKIEAEVGPIKYIAALIYGDNPDANLLERAVRWVIILIVLVFDPLALTLVIAANTSRRWENEDATTDNHNDNEHSNSEGTDEQPDRPNTVVDEVVPDEPKPDEPEKSVLEKYPYLSQGFKVPEGWGTVPPQVYTPEKEEVTEVIEPTPEVTENIEHKLDIIRALHTEEPLEEPKEEPKEIVTEGVTKEKPFKDVEGGYVVFEGKAMHKDAFTSLYPQFALMADNAQQVSTNFGPAFPKMANKGDVFVRVDILPNKVFKFDGSKWIEIQKETSNSYLYDESYIQYLVSEIEKGTYDVELLSDNERALIEEYLRTQKS